MTWVAYARLENTPAIVDAPRLAAPPSTQIAQRAQPAPLQKLSTPDAVSFDSALLDANYSLGAAPTPFGQNLPQGPQFVAVPPTPIVVVRNEPQPALSMLMADDAAETIPLPAPRPSILQVLNARALPKSRQRTMAALTPTVEEGGFFDRLFRSKPESMPLAYAAPEANLFGGAGRATFNPTAAYDGATAVYDISAHTVYLPNGTRLEAHSGLGNRLDDPRFVAEQNRGPTPPHLYDLQPREQLFHGVAALRLNPVGGGGIFGRNGLLAHTYMLGPNGDSNGCVSFSNYNAFLTAYKRGEIKRLAVVARL